MKIQILSDLHLEFQNPPDLVNAGADILVLGGDIFLAEYFYRNPRFVTTIDGDVKDLSEVINNGGYSNEARRWREFLQFCNDNWKHVIYLMGNHEHYKGRWDRTAQVLREEISYYPNIHFLEQDRIVIDDIQFLGATLWTDMNNHDPLTLMSARDFMNDYKAIKDFSNGSFTRLNANTTVFKHVETREWIKSLTTKSDMKTVVCTHHPPSRGSLHPRYANQHLMNGCFINDLDGLIADNPNIVLWTHGHVHDPFDYLVDKCRVVCNPRGYPGEITNYNPNLIIEI